MVATSLHVVALEGQTRWPLESCQLTVVVFAPSSIASLARVEHTMQVLFVVLRDEGRRHLLKAVPKHFRSRMRLALNSRPWALVWLCSRLHRCRITTLFAAYFSAAVVLPCG